MKCDKPDMNVGSKLPNALTDQWNRTVNNIYERNEWGPSLGNLIEFVDQKTTSIYDPVFSKEAIESFNGKIKKQPTARNRKLKTGDRNSAREVSHLF